MTQDELKLAYLRSSKLRTRLRRLMGSSYPAFEEHIESDKSSWEVASLYNLKAYQITMWRKVLTFQSRELVRGKMALVGTPQSHTFLLVISFKKYSQSEFHHLFILTISRTQILCFMFHWLFNLFLFAPLRHPLSCLALLFRFPGSACSGVA